MALVLKDRVRESSITAGTGTITLDGPISGFQSFLVIGDNNTTYYAIVDVDTGAFEVGLGTYTASSATLSRDVVLESSNSGNLVDFAAGIKDVFGTYPAEEAVTQNDIQTLTNKTIAFASNTLTDVASTNTAQTLTNKTLTSPAITTPTGIVKGDVGLGNVDNTSDATKNSATATLTNKTINLTSNTLVATSAQIAAAVTDETGTGALVFANSPTFVTPALGTPSSGVVTNLTGTASININGTVGATTPATGAFTNLAYTGTLTGGTGVVNLGSGQVVKDASGNVGIGTSSPTSTQSGLDISSGGLSLVVGANNDGTARTNATVKTSRIASFHFTNAEEPVGVLVVDSTSTGNIVNVGGSSGLINAATDIRFWTAANNTTTTGSERLRIDAAGNVGIGTSSPNARLSISGTEAADYGTAIAANSFLASAAPSTFLTITNSANTDGTFCGIAFDSFRAGTNGSRTYIANIAASTNNAGIMAFGRRTAAGASTESVRIDSAGNVGIGTSSPTRLLQLNSGLPVLQFTNPTTGTTSNDGTLLYQNGANFTIEQQDSGFINVFTGGSERMRIDSAGNVGIGTSSPVAPLHVNYTSSGMAPRISGNALARLDLEDLGQADGSRPFQFLSSDDGSLIFGNANRSGTSTTNSTERMRIDSSGLLLVGTTSSGAGASHTLAATGTTSDRLALVLTHPATNSAVRGLRVRFPNTNDDNGIFIDCERQSGSRFFVLSSGNVQNTNNSYGAISDVKLKENIVDATPKLEKLNQVRVVNFNLIGEEQKQIGVIAQELEQVFPGMVEERTDRDAEGNDLGTTTKSVKYSVFVPMLIKAIQEQQAIIESLKARLDAANI